MRSFKNEKALTLFLQNECKAIKDTHLVRIENSMNAGFPDTVVMTGGETHLMECKHVKTGNKLKIQPSQTAFAYNVCHKTGGAVLYMVAVEHKKEVFLYRISSYKQMLELTKQGIALKPCKVIDYNNNIIKETIEWISKKPQSKQTN